MGQHVNFGFAPVHEISVQPDFSIAVMIGFFDHDVSSLTPAVKCGRLANTSVTRHLYFVTEKSLQKMPSNRA
jgi:hypothetical protein